MNDTDPEVEARFRDLLIRRSGGERVHMACEMFDLARVLMVANIRTEHPGLSDLELRVKIFERTYAEDFGPVERTRILTRLRRPAS